MIACLGNLSSSILVIWRNHPFRYSSILFVRYWGNFWLPMYIIVRYSVLSCPTIRITQEAWMLLTSLCVVTQFSDPYNLVGTAITRRNFTLVSFLVHCPDNTTNWIKPGNFSVSYVALLAIGDVISQIHGNGTFVQFLYYLSLFFM